MNKIACRKKENNKKKLSLQTSLLQIDTKQYSHFKYYLSFLSIVVFLFAHIRESDTFRRLFNLMKGNISLKYENPTYWRHRISQPMHYAEVGDIQQGLGLPGKASL